MSRRADMLALLDGPASAVRGVSAQRASLLDKMGIRTPRDLLRNYPNRYIDLTDVSTCAAAQIGENATVVGTVHEAVSKQPRPNLNILEVSLVDDTGVILGVWFRQPWMAKRFAPGMRVAFTGKVSFDYGFKRMNSPFVEFLGEQQDAPTAAFIPVHATTQGLSTAWMRRLVANALDQCADAPDPLPVSLRAKHGLPAKKAAQRQMHFPSTRESLEQARQRLAYEELLLLQLEMMRRRAAETADGEGTCHTPGAAVAALRGGLPFTLTDGQETALAEILDDMRSARSMNRMLLGDVGCGKTVVAALAIAAVADTGTQCAMMAPTEVLAHQYAEKIGPLFDACGVSWGLLTGSTPAPERERLLTAAADGSLTCLFGTHALIEPDLVFKALTLTVIDEQHRFGVNQRAALREKGLGCDLLVMTATPIPRTLALALYGDLDTSYIRTRPAGRPATTTELVSRNNRGYAYDAIREAVASGRQAYIVCPLVGLSREQRAERSEDGRLQSALRGGADVADMKAAESEASFLGAKVFPEFSVGLLTGRMASAKKQQVMDDFASGKIQILVSTTVVEVGVDVPNATVMMVEDAERFGLSQLHQLRGRVGRGQHPGRFFLVADPGADDDELRARMDALVTCDDGFELAEADLKARREGDVLGSRQHGAARILRLANVVDDAALVAQAHTDAAELLRADAQLEEPEHKLLAHELELAFAQVDEDATEGA